MKNTERDTIAREKVNSFFNEELIIYNPLDLPVTIDEKIEEYVLEKLDKKTDADFDTTVRQLISVINEGVTGNSTPCKVTITHALDESKELPDLYAVENIFFIRRSSVSPSNREYYFEQFHFTEAEKIYNNIGINLAWRFRKAKDGYPDLIRVKLTTYFTYIELKQYYGNEIDDKIGQPFIVYNSSDT